MITYPNDLPCPALANNANANLSTTKTIEFDFAPRYRKENRANLQARYNFLIQSQAQADAWMSFYESLGNGTDTFNAQWAFMGQVGKHIWRFKDGYSIKQLSTTIYVISANLEIVDFQDGVNKVCPLLPTLTLTPSSILTPC